MSRFFAFSAFFFSIPSFSMDMISSASAGRRVTYWCTCSHGNGTIFFDEEVSSEKNCCNMHDIASDRNCAVREGGEAAVSCEGIIREQKSGK